MDQNRAERWREMEGTYALAAIHRVLGLTLHVVRAGEARIEYDGTENASNRHGNAAGGTLATMIDSAVVQACRTLLDPGDRATTLELKVNFVRPGPPGRPLHARGKIDHLGRSSAVGSARVEDLTGQLIAVGMVTVSLSRVGTRPATPER